MGYDDQALQEGERSLIEQLLAGSGVSWEELAREGTVRLYPEPRVQFAAGFPTPSGRIELASAAAEADGHPRLPEPSVDEPAPPGYLRLLSPASPWLMNATFGNDRKLRHRIGPASVALHPREAAGRGLRKGDPVTLRNATGALRLEIEISDAVPPGVAYAPKGRWPSHEPAGANVNALNPGSKTDIGRAPPSTACSSSSSRGSIAQCAPAAASSSRLVFPPGDLHELPASPKRFADGAHYRVEIPSTEGPRCLEAVLEEAGRLDVPVHRVSQGSGVFLLTDEELDEMVAMAHSATVRGEPVRPAERGLGRLGDGARAGGRGRGAGVARPGAVGVGPRGREARGRPRRPISVLIADLGLLACLRRDANRRRAPRRRLQAKVSVMLPVSNAGTARVVAGLGANTINVTTDLSLAQIAAIRAAVDVPARRLRRGAGQRRRVRAPHEIPEIVRVCCAGLPQVRPPQRARRLPGGVASGRDSRSRLTAGAGAPRAHRPRAARA